MKILAACIALLTLTLPPALRADDLLDVYNLALERDLLLRTAQSKAMAGALTQDIAVTEVLPTIRLGASTSEKRIRSTTGENSRRTDDSSKNELEIRVPLYSTVTKIALDRSETQERIAALELRKSQIDLAGRVVEAYFGVLATKDNLETARLELDTIKEFLDQAQRRFEVGIGTETDVRNAEARASLANANTIEAENRVEIAWVQLEESIVTRPDALSGLDQNFEPPPPDPNDVTKWIQLAKKSNLDIALQREAVDIAHHNISLTNSDSVLFSNLSILYNDHHGDGPAAEERSNVTLRIGKSFSAAGGETKRRKQAVHAHEAEVQRLGAIMRTVETRVSNTYRNILNLINRVAALKEAVAASQSALSATEEGYRVGTQTTLDVLNAQRDLFEVARDLQRARYDYLLNITELSSLAGTLQDENIEQINRWLVN